MVFLLKSKLKINWRSRAFNPSTREAEAGGSLWVRGQPGLQIECQDRLQSYTENPCLEKPRKKWKKNVKRNSSFSSNLNTIVFKLYSQQRYTITKNAHISLGISCIFSFLLLVSLGVSIFCRVICILASIWFPSLPLGTYSPFFAGPFLGFGSGFTGPVLAGNLPDLLCGSSFNLALSL